MRKNGKILCISSFSDFVFYDVGSVGGVDWITRFHRKYSGVVPNGIIIFKFNLINIILIY